MTDYRELEKYANETLGILLYIDKQPEPGVLELLSKEVPGMPEGIEARVLGFGDTIQGVSVSELTQDSLRAVVEEYKPSAIALGTTGSFTYLRFDNSFCDDSELLN